MSKKKVYLWEQKWRKKIWEAAGTGKMEGELSGAWILHLMRPADQKGTGREQKTDFLNTQWCTDGSSRHRLPGGQIPTLAHTSLRPWTRCTTFHSMFICNVRMRMWAYRVWEKLHESPVLNEKTSCVWRRIIFQSCYLGALVTGFF